MKHNQKKYLQVVKSNSLIQAKYRLSIQEQRIMLLAISQISKDEVLTDQVMYSVQASDFKKFTGISLKQSYEELKKAALKLKRREVSIYEKPNGQGKHDEILVAGWVQSIKYVKNQSRVDLRFNHDMVPYLNELRKEFTAYVISKNEQTSLLKMNSSYAFRIYELMMQWKGTASEEDVCERAIELSWIREIFDLPDSYKAIGELKRRVLNPALKEINENSPYWVKMSQEKSGRIITHIRLIFGHKAPLTLNKKRGKTKKINVHDEKFLAQHAKPGESREAAIRRLKAIHG